MGLASNHQITQSPDIHFCCSASSVPLCFKGFGLIFGFGLCGSFVPFVFKARVAQPPSAVRSCFSDHALPVPRAPAWPRGEAVDHGDFLRAALKLVWHSRPRLWGLTFPTPRATCPARAPAWLRGEAMDHDRFPPEGAVFVFSIVNFDNFGTSGNCCSITPP